MPADMGNSAWAEIDANNNTAAPTGWPDGQAPSTVKQTGRGMMGALKRFWARANGTLSTAGTTTAYTLAYGQAAAQYYAGEEFSFVANATCGAAPTLNVNGLGAHPLRKFAGGAYANCVAGDILANQPVRVRYNSAGGGTFDIVAQAGGTAAWQAVDSQTLVAAANYDLQGIAASINVLDVLFDLTTATNNVDLYLQFYDSGGSLDSTGICYSALWITNSAGASAASNRNASSVMALGTQINNSAAMGCSGRITILNIQAVKRQTAVWQSLWTDQAGALFEFASGNGVRAANGPITGIRLVTSSGNVSGRVTTLGTAN